MSKTNPAWAEETKRVDWLIGEIDKRLSTLQQQVSERREETVAIRKNFWDDVTVNFEDAAEAAETYASIKQQSEVLSEKERFYRHAQKQLMTLKRLRRSPYFGRIDFAEDGEKHAEQIYLGIASFMDENEEHFLVYDWRAPVSSLYYDYPPGPAKYVTPGGTIHGTIELKRQYMIRDGQMISMFDTGVTIGDELLQEVLGQHSDAQMKSIVATIQKEQNQIIRNETSRLLVVLGAAGSGKTSAALQRVAYLLYRYRETLRAELIVLFSPNQMFNSYISTVLPELGEENMQQTTFQDYLAFRLGRTFQLEDPFTQMEYELTAMNEPGYEARLEGIRLKASYAFVQVMERYITYLGREGLMFRDIKFHDETLISAKRIREQFYALDSSISIPNRLQLVVESLLEQLKELARLEITKPWVEDEIELLDKEAYVSAYQNLKRKKQFHEDSFNDFDREQEALAMKVVQKHFKKLRSLVKQLRFVHIPRTYRQLYADPTLIARLAPDLMSDLASGIAPDLVKPHYWQEICTQTTEKLGRAELAYEDATPYLYLKERIEGFQTNNAIRHVFIDEAQDYSPFQFAFIQKMFPHSKMTALGDLNQAIYPQSAANNGFEALRELYGSDRRGGPVRSNNEQVETFKLTRSYRSTRQIVEFTRQLIPGGETIEPIHREGGKPTVTQAKDTSEQLALIVDRLHQLQKAGHRSIAVICKTAQESKEAYDAISAYEERTYEGTQTFEGTQTHEPLRLIEKETATFETGTVVIPAYLAKGVEFDAVIIYNGSQAQYGRERERKLFYTACTRAMHELFIFYVDKVSVFIADVSPDTYLAKISFT